jgi:very-short-patch-repair endonuclease
MRPDHAAELSGQPDGQVRAALETWRSGLVDLTDANRLLNFGRTPSDAVEITGPSPKSLIKTLQEEGAFGFPGGDPEDQRPVLRTDLREEELGALLHRFYRRSRQEFLDRGVSSLYLAVGMLHWTDDRNTPYQSPILLIPVEIDPEGPLLRVRGDDPMVNPALALRMQALDIELPEVHALADLDVTVLWAHIDVAIGELRSWYADETVVLSSFGVHRESIHADLVENEPHIAEHPLVRALATHDVAGKFGFEPPDPDRIDVTVPPEDAPLVLDADAGQRVCVAAALAGHSFVIEGAPGTGKSQTIANIVGGLLHAGKRVLVVSEKAAALDTVAHRLAGTGLGNYLLPLHSDLTGRREVAAALTAALDTDPVPLASMDPIDRRAVRERRERLSAYADTLNLIRQPLGRSLHEVIGICATLHDVPAAPVPTDIPVDRLTPEAFDEMRAAVGRLGRVRSDSYLWREATERDPMEGRLRTALTSLGTLAETVIANSVLADAFDLHEPAGAGTLAALAAHAGHRPGTVIEEWLSLPSLKPVQEAADDLTRHLAALRYGGIPWAELPSAADLSSVPDLSHLSPPAVDLSPLNAAQAEHLSNKFAEEADRLETRQESLDRVTARLGLPHVVTFPDSVRVITIAGLIARDHKPEAAWFAEGGMAAAHAAVRALRRAVEAVNAAEQRARKHFDEGVLKEPIEEMADRLTNRRGARKLFGTYRRDKKAAIDAALPEVKPEDAVANVEDAALWKTALDELEEAAEEHAAILGKHWDGMDTDFAAVQEALHTADEVIRETPADALAAVVVHVCAPRPNNALLRIVGEAREEFDRFRTTLRPAPARAPRPELAEGAVQEAVDWLRAHVAPLRSAAEMLRAYGGPTGRGDLTLAEAVEIAQQRQAAIDAESAIWSNAGPHAAVLGSIYRGTKTDDNLMNEIVKWSAEARRLHRGHDEPLTTEQAHALAACVPSDGLAAAVANWEHAREQVLNAFGPDRRIELGTHLGDYDSARDLMMQLLHDTGGQQEWFVHLDARLVLTEFGLADALEFCADKQLPVEQIWAVLERALYRGWVDAILRDDGGLQPIDVEDRIHLVEVFKLLDVELTSGAIADIVYAVEARRPSAANAGEPALIRREGNKKTGHLAVRDLIAQARHAIQALKPCLLMSPLAVSRLLPPEIEFDVVIIDEASQVTTADAINCVYRGDALIVAGDDRQLPPTTYYDRVEDDVTDFPSIFDLAKDTFRTLQLGWHHRSRHEALFAFANLAYYQGRLVSLPRAYAREPDHGVQLYHVDGVYHRMTSSDNAIEADAVAARVLHHLTNRPEKSLGVVTLSVAQADAIDTAVQRMIADRPDLDHLLDDSDRLNGFFVKSLEAVQGDVRDVIILSIGYGYDEHDKISTNFGVLNRPKGWRRLNVAITRARQRVEVVSSIHAVDVPDMGNESVRHLKAFLEYAERDAATLGRDVTEHEGMTPFEQSVLHTIAGWGYSVRRQIGAAGHWIDLGILHPDHPDEVYALGIEFDGPGYRAVPSARDRDRLRDQELRELGWHLHRIWSTAWYRNQPEEAGRLLGAIQRALADPQPGFDRLPAHAWGSTYRPLRGQLLAEADEEKTEELES